MSTPRRGAAAGAAILAAALGAAAVMSPSGPGGAQEVGAGGVDKWSLDLPYDAPRGTSEEEAAELIVFHGQAYPARGLFFCLDQSMSMADGEWKALVKEFHKTIAALREDNELGLSCFAEDVMVFPASRKPVRATAANKAAAQATIDGLKPQTWTCLLKGLEEALKLAQAATVERPVILLLSDGKPTCPGEDFASYRKRTLEEAVKQNTRRVPIHTLGIGADVDEAFLKELAGSSGGTYRRLTR